MDRTRSFTAVMLCAAAWILCTHAAMGPVTNCCLTFTKKKVSPQRLVDYSIQDSALCPIQAVVLKTLRGKHLCSRADQTWVQEAMRKVDEKKCKGGSKQREVVKKRHGRRRKGAKAKQAGLG